MNLRESVEQMLLEYAPTCLVINRAADILYVHGRTGKYLETPPGEVGPANALRMVPAELRSPLSAGVARAITEKQVVTYDRIPVGTDGGKACIRLTVRPLTESGADEELLTVTFDELPPAACAPGPPASGPEAGGEQGLRITELERDLSRGSGIPPGHGRGAGIRQRGAALGQ